MSDSSHVQNIMQPPELDLEKLLRVNRAMNQILGEAVSLMLPMPKYQDWRIADLKARLLPPITLQQCKIFRHKGFPVAFVSWALVNEDIEKRLQQSPELPLGPREWRSGPKLCFMDIASPKGNEDEIKDAVRKALAKSSSKPPG
jgi:cytolysin-activating lysine-acyltransferase